MISRIINQRYGTMDYISRKKMEYLFIFSVILITFMPVLFLSLALSRSGNLLNSGITIAVIVAGAAATITLIFAGKHTMAVHVLLAIVAGALAGGIIVDQRNLLFANAFTFITGFIVMTVLFSSRTTATVYFLLFLGFQFFYSFLLRGENVPTNLVNGSLINSTGATILTYAIAMILVSTLNRAVEKQREESEKNRELYQKTNALLESVKEHIAELSSSAEEMAQTVNMISDGAQSQAAGVEEMASSLEEMATTVSQNAANSRSTDDIAQKSSSEAEDGGRAVRETVSAMKKITEKISLIEDIAYQTNLLALNAAIEAARAGEHGRGFAVVAGEVRKLAEKSQTASQEISELAKVSVEIAENAGTLLETILPNIRQTANLVQEISIASEQQDQGLRQIKEGVEQLNEITQQNAAAAEELASTADMLSTHAFGLQDMVDSFYKGGEAKAGSPVPEATRKAGTPVKAAAKTVAKAAA